MAIKLRFLGAAQNVTGSRYLLEADGIRVLVDYLTFYRIPQEHWRRCEPRT